jgi:hypothetical protein
VDLGYVRDNLEHESVGATNDSTLNDVRQTQIMVKHRIGWWASIAIYPTNE